jgi:lactoylglutathione lyase
MRQLLILISLSATLALPVQAQSEATPAADSIRLDHIAVYVYNLETSTNFYDHILRFKKIPEPFHDGRHTWYSLGAGSQLHLIQGAKQDVERDKNDHLCFSVPSVAHFVARLEENDVPYFDWPGAAQSITTRVDGVQQLYFQDPDGHWIEVNDAGFQ